MLPESLFDPSIDAPLTEQEKKAIEDFITTNAVMSRSQLMQRFFDERRDLNKECGYPERINSRDYRDMYDHFGIGARVVEIYPNSCWRSTPTVYEDKDTETKTEFEMAWDALSEGLELESWYQDEERSPIWSYLHRADLLSGIGHFGVLLIGIDDGLPLDMPVAGFPPDNQPDLAILPETNGKPIKANADFSRNGKEKENGKPPVNGKPDVALPELNPAKRIKEEMRAKEGTVEEQVSTFNGRKLIYLRTFDESSVQITQWENNPANPRYSLPVMYQITLYDPENNPENSVGMPTSTVNVHWSRIIHIAEKLTNNEVFGIPRMRQCYPRLLDLRKLYGASAEMFYKGAFMGLSFETHPQMGSNVRLDQKAMRAQAERYFNGLQRYVATAGMHVSPLAPQVADPTNHIKAQLEAICIQLGIPMRIFMGSERGELSSNQDMVWFREQVKGRREQYIIPKIITPFVNRLIQMGVLPEPSGFSVEWAEEDIMDPKEKADIASVMTSAMSTYVSSGIDTLMDPFDFLVRVLHFTEEDAEEIMLNVTMHLASVAPDTEQPIVPGREPIPAGLDPMGNPLDDEDENPDGDPMILKPGDKAVGSKSGREIAKGEPIPKEKKKPTTNSLLKYLLSKDLYRDKVLSRLEALTEKELKANAKKKATTRGRKKGGSNCGANAPGGGGFQKGNTCASGDGMSWTDRVTESLNKALGLSATASKRRLTKFEKEHQKKFDKAIQGQTKKLRDSISKQGLARAAVRTVQSKGVVNTVINRIILGRGKREQISNRVEAWGVQGSKQNPFRMSFKNQDSLTRWAQNNRAIVHGVSRQKPPTFGQRVIKSMKNRVEGVFEVGHAITNAYASEAVSAAMGLGAMYVLGKYGGITFNSLSANKSDKAKDLVMYFVDFYKDEMKKGTLTEDHLRYIISAVQLEFEKDDTYVPLVINAWSDEARKKSAEVRKSKAGAPSKLEEFEMRQRRMKRGQSSFKPRTGGGRVGISKTTKTSRAKTRVPKSRSKPKSSSLRLPKFGKKSMKKAIAESKGQKVSATWLTDR